MATIVQEPYNLFARQKMAGYPNSQNQQQVVVPGNIQGATVQDFAAGKQAANSQAQGYGANPITPMEPAKKVEPVKQVKPVERVTQQPITTMEDLAKAMGYTSPEEENRIRKASVANQRILALGDALRHIGNIYHTVNYAPSQQFNNPVQEERQRYLQGKALRDKANLTYMNYMQAKAAQDQKMRQWEAEQAAKERQFRYNAAKDAANLKAQQDYHNATIAERARQADQNLAFNKDKQKATEDRWKRQDAETQRYHKAQTGLGYARLKETKRHNNVIETKTGNGRTGSPYTLPTKEGYLEMARDLNTNQIGKKALFAEMKNAGIIDDVWETRYNNMFSSEAQAALLNTAISQWLMTDEDAPTYMQEHFNAKRYGNSGSTGTMPGVGGGGSSNTMPGVRN